MRSRVIASRNPTKKGIPVESLNDQRPLTSSVIERCDASSFAYPGLGRLVDRDAIAEMLVVLSRRQETGEHRGFTTYYFLPLILMRGFISRFLF